MSSLKNITCLLCLFGSMVSAQMQKDYLIHKRGMLHQTVYNTGELGRKYVTSNANTELGIPSFEWPGNSATIVDAKQYTGWHNSYGGGVQIAADRVDSSKRLIAYCGGEIDAQHPRWAALVPALFAAVFVCNRWKQLLFLLSGLAFLLLTKTAHDWNWSPYYFIQSQSTDNTLTVFANDNGGGGNN
ncbi:MAG: hypothetical protein WCI84_03680, partial [Bacteroidota bacterium]